MFCVKQPASQLERSSLALACVALLISQPALGQVEPRLETPRAAQAPAAAPTTTIPINTMEATEVMQAERPVLNPQVTPALALEEPLDPKTYIVGRGDNFELNFWGRQNFKLRVTVDLEGRAFISKIGYVDIQGKTLAEARTIVRRAVQHYYPGLNFDMTLSAPRTFLVHVVGYVAKPGIYPSNPLERVSSVLNAAGGVTGSWRRIQIRHRDGSSETADLTLYLQTGKTGLNPHLLDGDVIDVPFADVVVTIKGAVQREAQFELIATKDLAELLELAGGLRNEVTRILPIRVIRRQTAKQLAETILLPFPSGGGAPNAQLKAGDHVYVPGVSELQRAVFLYGAIAGANPADEATAVRRLPYVDGDTVRALLERTGGVGAGADLKGAFIRRENGTVVPVDLDALLVHREFSVDRQLAVGDTVVVPYRRRSVLVEGAVGRPGVLQFNPELRASQYVELAGGGTRMAESQSSIKIITPAGKTIKNAASLLPGPGDTVLLPERTFSRTDIAQLVMGAAGLLLSGVALVVVVVK